MRVTYENNTLVVVTSISKETVKRGLTDLTARDEKGNAKYQVFMSDNESASLDKFAMKGNAFIDNKVAAVIVQKEGTTLADVQKKYGEALLAAEKYTSEIVTAAEDKEAAIAGLFTVATAE